MRGTAQFSGAIGFPSPTGYNTVVDNGVDNGVDNLYLKRADVMRPVDAPPYYATGLRLNTLCLTSTGLRIDSDARVYDNRTQPVAGLYAAGECTGGSSAMFTSAVATPGPTASYTAASRADPPVSQPHSAPVRGWSRAAGTHQSAQAITSGYMHVRPHSSDLRSIILLIAVPVRAGSTLRAAACASARPTLNPPGSLPEGRGLLVARQALVAGVSDVVAGVAQVAAAKAAAMVDIDQAEYQCRTGCGLDGVEPLGCSAVEEQCGIREEDFCMLRLRSVTSVGKY
jgi:hypothetical protein